MPFTPLHMGPGVLFKAFLRGSFSLMVFGWAQIVIDIQPLVVLFTGRGHLHGFTHTYIGASVFAVFTALSGKYLGEFGLRMIGRRQFLPIGWLVACVSAAIGTYSHVFMDSIIYLDINPLWPFSPANGLLAIVSIDTLHWLCIGCALVGAVLYFVFGSKPARHIK